MARHDDEAVLAESLARVSNPSQSFNRLGQTHLRIYPKFLWRTQGDARLRRFPPFGPRVRRLGAPGSLNTIDTEPFVSRLRGAS